MCTSDEWVPFPQPTVEELDSKDTKPLISTKNHLAVKCPRKSCNLYVKARELSRHIRFVHDKIKEPCKNCGKEILKCSLARHLARCTSNGERKFLCLFAECGASFVMERDLTRHVKYVHVTAPVKCPHSDCDSYMKPSNLGVHLESVHMRIKETCPKCGKQLMLGYLKQHLQRCGSEGEKKFHCPVEQCKSSFVIRNDLKAHLNKVHALPVKCPRENCDAWVKPGSLSQHISRRHDRTKQPCEKCGKLVLKLKLHLDRCTSDGVRRYCCANENCKATFTAKQNLDLHVYRVHSLPVMCPREGCHVYVKPSNLTQHVKLVHDKVKRACENCGKQVSCANFRQHFEKCTSDGVKRYSCTIEDCKSSFVTKKYLQAHVKGVHDAAVINCPHEDCGMSLKFVSLQQHLKTVHKLCRNCGTEHSGGKCAKNEKEKFSCANCEASFTSKKHMYTHFVTAHEILALGLQKHRQALRGEVEN